MLVVKVGGGGGVDLKGVCRDVARLIESGRRLVLVHGGSREMDEMSTKLGHPPRFVTTPSGFKSRYTDRKTLDIFVMVMAGRVNKLLVERLQAHGVNAVGLCGLDGGLVRGRRKGTIIALEDGKRKVLRGDYGGTVKEVNTPLLRLLLAKGYTPVVAPLAIGEESEALNVDGDRVAAALAAALGAEDLIILSNVPGLLTHPADEGTLIRKVPRAEARDYLDRYAQGRMKKKLLSAIEALERGVRRVVLADGRTESPLSRALAGQGTVIE